MKSGYKRLGGLSLVEVLVAMVVLSIGLLGMTMMTIMVMRGSKSAAQVSAGTNLCQTKLEELKDMAWQDLGVATSGDPEEDQRELGLDLGQMYQESDINELGQTWAQQFAVEVAQVGNPCHGLALAPSMDEQNACAARLMSLGPYVYVRTFVICKGEDYDLSGNPPTGTNTLASAVEGVVRPAKEPDCRVKPIDASRPEALTCQSSDITASAGSTAAMDEKVIKILCTWRNKDASCGSVATQTTVVNLSL